MLVVIACGSVASTALLLRSAPAFSGARAIDASGALGKNVSGNGDYGVTGIVGARYEFPVEGFKGKPMSSFTPSFWKQDKFILIPFYAAPLHLALNQPSSILRAEDHEARGRGSATPAAGERDYGLAYKTRLREFFAGAAQFFRCTGVVSGTAGLSPWPAPRRLDRIRHALSPPPRPRSLRQHESAASRGQDP